MNEDIDYMGQQLLGQGVLPGDFFNTSFSELMAVQNAKPRKDRAQDPLAVARQLGLSSL